MTATSMYQMNVLCSSVHCHFGKAPPQTKFSVWLPCSLRYSSRELKETEEHQQRYSKLGSMPGTAVGLKQQTCLFKNLPVQSKVKLCCGELVISLNRT
jgi:hypothetical protein